jgi:hypothetical protein
MNLEMREDIKKFVGGKGNERYNSWVDKKYPKVVNFYFCIFLKGYSTKNTSITVMGTHLI